MQCIYCEANMSRAVDTRIIKGKKIVKRRRECLKCHKRFTTYEQAIVLTGKKNI